MTLFFGKYRGKVVNNVDPMFMGRVMVSCPTVLGLNTINWAMPSSPYAGPGVGFFAIPPVGANIWVEFEGGDPDYPIYSGCFWGIGEAPMPAAASVTPVASMKVFKTESITLTLNDLPGAGGVELDIAPPSVAIPLNMKFDSSGIKITDSTSTITMTPTGIEIKCDPSTVKIEPSAIESTSGTGTVKIEPSAVSLECTSTVKIDSSAIEMANSSVSTKITSSAIEMANGGTEMKLESSKAALKSTKVDVNDGSLEVT